MSEEFRRLGGRNGVNKELDMEFFMGNKSREGLIKIDNSRRLNVRESVTEERDSGD